MNGATLSPDRNYRYHLWRSWGNRFQWGIPVPINRRCVFVGLNPSTADECKDDPTIRKCVGFAKLWGFDALDMVNLFAWRSTNPRGLLTVKDPVGQENEATLQQVCTGAGRIVLAWGSHSAKIQAMVRLRLPMLTFMCGKVGTLGRTANGSPLHPLRLAYTRTWQQMVVAGAKVGDGARKS